MKSSRNGVVSLGVYILGNFNGRGGGGGFMVAYLLLFLQLIYLAVTNGHPYHQGHTSILMFSHLNAQAQGNHV